MKDEKNESSHADSCIGRLCYVEDSSFMAHPPNARSPALWERSRFHGLVGSPGTCLHRNEGSKDRPNVQAISAKGLTPFASRTRPPEFLCRGVCLGGALHGNPEMKRAETRDYQMSPISLDRPRHAACHRGSRNHGACRWCRSASRSCLPDPARSARRRPRRPSAVP